MIVSHLLPQLSPFPPSLPYPNRRELVIRNMKTTLKTETLQSCPSAVTTIDCCGMTLTSDDLRTLEPLGWLNDQVINCYFKLLVRSSPSKVSTLLWKYLFPVNPFIGRQRRLQPTHSSIPSLHSVVTMASESG